MHDASACNWLILGYCLFKVSGGYLLSVHAPSSACPHLDASWSLKGVTLLMRAGCVGSVGVSVQRSPHAVDPSTGAFKEYAGISTIDWLHVPDHAVIDFIHLTNHFWHHNVMTEAAVPQVSPPQSCYLLALFLQDCSVPEHVLMLI